MKSFIFHEGAVQSGHLYGDWAQLCAALSVLPRGSAPEVTFTKSFEVPLAGMPDFGWRMGDGSWKADTPQTGAVKVTIPHGVKVDHLTRIENGLLVEVLPATDYNVFEWTGNLGGVRVLEVGLGAALVNYGSAPMIATPGNPVAQTYTVLAFFQASQAAVPPSTAPFVHVRGQDVLIANTQSGGGFTFLHDNWATGGGGDGVDPDTQGMLWYQNGLESPSPAIPNWAGKLKVTNGTAARNLNVTLDPAHFAGEAPKDVEATLNRMAAALAGLLGTPIP